MTDPPAFWWAVEGGKIYGNAAGYSRASVALKTALVRAGAVEHEQAMVAVHFCYPRNNFRPIPGRHNVLFTMYETPKVPPWFIEAFAQADSIIVPCEYSREIFRPHTDRPIYVVPLGVDPALFPLMPRQDPRVQGRPWRFLWAGAHNLRKGWREVLDAWMDGRFIERDDCELYLKITDAIQIPQPIRDRNILVDPRVVTDRELLHIYANADAFIFPSYGEGFGLTLLEAMATGLPSIAPLHTGIKDFADHDTVVSVKFEQINMFLEEFDKRPGGSPTGLLRPWPAPCLRARVPDLIRKMHSLMHDYPRAHALGMRAHERAQEFTWDKAGVKLRAVLEAIEARLARQEERRA